MALDQVDQVADIRGKICPYTLIDTREALKRLSTGQVLEVVSDYEPAATATIPHFCEKKGYPIEVHDSGDGTWRIRIRRTD
jgi:tRNA 2-thiouridine synthesizing protein A